MCVYTRARIHTCMHTFDRKLYPCFFCNCHTEWVTIVWEHGFIDVPSIPADLKDGLLDNADLSNKLADLHDLLLPWALHHQHSSAQSKHKIFCKRIH